MPNNFDAFTSELLRNTLPAKVGATSLAEQVWCRWFGREIYQGLGALVEWGPWLGSLTASYCEGLAKNTAISDRKKFVHVYDLFKWSPQFESWAANSPHAKRFADNEDFLRYFCELHHVHESFLNVHQADLSKARWSGNPIEWIVNDAVKSLNIGTNLFRHWIPSMIPGKSFIAHQDYLWSTNSFIQVYMYLVRDSFEYEYTVPDGCLVVFRNKKQCDPDVLSGHGLESGKLSRDLINETFDWSQKTLSGVDPAVLGLCRSATLRDFGFVNEAREIAARHLLTSASPNPMLNFQRDVLLSWGYSDILMPQH